MLFGRLSGHKLGELGLFFRREIEDKDGIKDERTRERVDDERISVTLCNLVLSVGQPNVERTGWLLLPSLHRLNGLLTLIRLISIKSCLSDPDVDQASAHPLRTLPCKRPVLVQPPGQSFLFCFYCYDPVLFKHWPHDPRKRLDSPTSCVPPTA